MVAGKKPELKISKATWNYTPELPIKTAPYFDWPPNPARIGSWIMKRWFPITERGLLVCLAILIWTFATPALERCKTIEFAWIAEIYIRNFALMCLVAGGAHLYLYTFSKQRKTLNEQYEDSELLRFIDLGYKIKMQETTVDSIAVDVPSDIQKVENFLNQH